MNKEEIIAYVKENRYAEPARLQKKFGISYVEATSIIDELVSRGTLVYAGGVRYDLVGLHATGDEVNRSAFLNFFIGMNDNHQPVYGDLLKMRHLLIGGAVDMGQMDFLHSMMKDFIRGYTPDDLRLILADCKGATFGRYQNLPHLLTGEIVSDPQQLIQALNWAIREMNTRYTLFQQMTKEGRVVRNLTEYNRARTKDEAFLPRIVLIIAELSDFMRVTKQEVEDLLIRLTQKSRAAGILCVFSTQHPSPEFVTDPIRGNVASRIAFRTRTERDSFTLLDQEGADELSAAGEMLYYNYTANVIEHLHCPKLDEDELHDLIETAKKSYPPQFNEEARAKIHVVDASDCKEPKFLDPAQVKALALAVKLGHVTATLLQRQIGFGFQRATAIVVWMEKMGYVAPSDGTGRVRKVLLSKEEFEKLYGNLD